MEIIKKIMDYIKQNKLYVTVMLIGCIMFLLQMSHVVLYADDLSLGSIAKQGISGAFEHLVSNYMNWGGGPTPFFVILLFFIPLKIWKIFNCVMIATTIILTIRMICFKWNKINKGILAIALWICVYILNIHISSQTLYWLDGNIAYVLTAFQLFIYFYYLYSRLIMKTEGKKYDYVLLPIVAFFSGWTGPQTGALTVIISIVLLVWVKWIHKEKIKPIYLVSTIIGIIGFLVYYLAPGNNGRMLQGFPQFAQYNLFEKVYYRIDSVWQLLFDYKQNNFGSIPLYLYLVIGMVASIAIKLVKEEAKKWIKNSVTFMSIVLLIFLILNFALSIGLDYNESLTHTIFRFESILGHMEHGTLRLQLLIPYMVTMLMMAFTVLLTYYISQNEKNPLLVILVTGALLGQAMMVLSPYSPLRTTFITVYLLWLAIAVLMMMIAKNKVNIIWVVSMVLATIFGLNLGLIVLVTYAIFYYIQEPKEEKYMQVQKVAILLILGIVSLLYYKQMIKGYQENEKIYYENVARIEEFKKQENSGDTLYLKKPLREEYGFTPFVGTKWVEDDVKRYFEVDENVIIKELQE